MHKDILGEPLTIGSRIAYATGSCEARLKIGVVLGLEYPRDNVLGEPLPHMVRVRVDFVSDGRQVKQHDLIDLRRVVKL